jgi:uncharacterized protein YjbJ (UPF0337 family)
MPMNASRRLDPGLPCRGLVFLMQGSRRGPLDQEARQMGVDDKAKNKAQEVKGQAKEGLGRATDDQELEAEGRTDQAKSDLKQAGEKVKDAFRGR